MKPSHIYRDFADYPLFLYPPFFSVPRRLFFLLFWSYYLSFSQYFYRFCFCIITRYSSSSYFLLLLLLRLFPLLFLLPFFLHLLPPSRISSSSCYCCFSNIFSFPFRLASPCLAVLNACCLVSSEDQNLILFFFFSIPRRLGGDGLFLHLVVSSIYHIQINSRRYFPTGKW